MDRISSTRLSCLVGLCLLAVPVAALPVYARGARRAPSKVTTQITRASWYGEFFKGRRTAGGGVFDPQHLTAAHPTLDIGSMVKVTELHSGRSVIVEITDRGPFLPGRGIDLSYAAARQLGIVRRGIARVRLDLVEADKPPVSPPIVTAFIWPTTARLPKAIVE